MGVAKGYRDGGGPAVTGMGVARGYRDGGGQGLLGWGCPPSLSDMKIVWFVV